MGYGPDCPLVGLIVPLPGIIPIGITPEIPCTMADPFT